MRRNYPLKGQTIVFTDGTEREIERVDGDLETGEITLRLVPKRGQSNEYPFIPKLWRCQGDRWIFKR